MSTGMYNFGLPVPILKWASKDIRNRLSHPSSPPESDDPIQEQPQQEQLVNTVAVVTDESSNKQWNLRSRKHVFTHQSPDQTNEAMDLDGDISERSERNKEKLWISLSEEEIEEDLYSMTGSLPSRRPKKRTRVVQKLVDVS